MVKCLLRDRDHFLDDGHSSDATPLYEGDVVKRFMNLVALQPLVVDEAFMPHMKAMDVPFHTMYGSLICFKGLQSDRPKC